MTRGVITIQRERSAADASLVMAREKVGSLVVCAGRAVVGIITDRDVTVRCVARGFDPEKTPVEAMMSAGVLTCLADAPLWQAQQLMETNHVRRLVIVGADGSVEGLLSTDDLALVPVSELARPPTHFGGPLR